MQNQSEVARILSQITAEYQSAWMALEGLSMGIAQHAFIASKMENMWAMKGELGEIVGDDEASKLFSAQLDKS